MAPRNAAKPAGLYFGNVSNEMFDLVVTHIIPPTQEEGLPIEVVGDAGQLDR